MTRFLVQAACGYGLTPWAFRDSWRFLGWVALLPMVGVALASAAAWYFFKDNPLDARVVQIVYVGLAALTVPHMVLVERVRLMGWIRPPAA